MDASFVSIKSGTNEARDQTHILTPTSSPLPTSLHKSEICDRPIKLVPITNIGTKHVRVSTEYIKHSNQRNSSECTIADRNTTRQKASSATTTSTNPSTVTTTIQLTPPDSFLKDNCSNTKSNDKNYTQSRTDANSRGNSCSVRSASSPQLTTKPLTRSKVYRKASLKSSANSPSSVSDRRSITEHKKNLWSSDVRIINVSSCAAASTDRKMASAVTSYALEQRDRPDGKERERDTSATRNKWNTQEVHITCNPLSVPYPYSTPHHSIVSEAVTEPLEDEPKSRSCGSFLPILSLIPQTVISFQYLSPKMKFSWWRNKIS